MAKLGDGYELELMTVPEMWQALQAARGEVGNLGEEAIAKDAKIARLEKQLDETQMGKAVDRETPEDRMGAEMLSWPVRVQQAEQQVAKKGAEIARLSVRVNELMKRVKELDKWIQDAKDILGITSVVRVGGYGGTSLQFQAQAVVNALAKAEGALAEALKEPIVRGDGEFDELEEELADANTERADAAKEVIRLRGEAAAAKAVLCEAAVCNKCDTLEQQARAVVISDDALREMVADLNAKLPEAEAALRDRLNAKVDILVRLKQLAEEAVEKAEQISSEAASALCGLRKAAVLTTDGEVRS